MIWIVVSYSYVLYSTIISIVFITSLYIIVVFITSLYRIAHMATPAPIDAVVAMRSVFTVKLLPYVLSSAVGPSHSQSSLYLYRDKRPRAIREVRPAVT